MVRPAVALGCLAASPPGARAWAGRRAAPAAGRPRAGAGDGRLSRLRRGLPPARAPPSLGLGQPGRGVRRLRRPAPARGRPARARLHGGRELPGDAEGPPGGAPGPPHRRARPVVPDDGGQPRPVPGLRRVRPWPWRAAWPAVRPRSPPGLYLALGPRFLTVFSLNCVGQYVDVLALGGLALALLARMLDERPQGRGRARSLSRAGPPAGGGVLAAAGRALLRRGRSRRSWPRAPATWRDPWTLLAPAGAVLGALPVLLWNLQHGWATRDILGREPLELRAQAEALPHLVARTLSVSFPILAGLSPEPPVGRRARHARRGRLAVPARCSRATWPCAARTSRHGCAADGPRPPSWPPCSWSAVWPLFWAVASGSVYRRPRYLLPVAAASAVHGGRPVRVALGPPARPPPSAPWPRCSPCTSRAPRRASRASAAIARRHEDIVRSLEDKGIRTGYSDFSISAPVTMFTAERIVLSPAPGAHARLRVGGPRAPRRGSRVRTPTCCLRRTTRSASRPLCAPWGSPIRVETKPVTVFYDLSRRVRLDEVAAFRGAGPEAAGPPDE